LQENFFRAAWLRFLRFVANCYFEIIFGDPSQYGQQPKSNNKVTSLAGDLCLENHCHKAEYQINPDRFRPINRENSAPGPCQKTYCKKAPKRIAIQANSFAKRSWRKENKNREIKRIKKTLKPIT